MMDQVKLLILCILKWSWGWYKAMMASQPHHITSDSVCNSLIYMQFCNVDLYSLSKELLLYHQNLIYVNYIVNIL